MQQQRSRFETYKLSDRYTRSDGRVFLTGTQALVRIMLDQSRRDESKGLNTAGFVSGYRGSPLGAVDLEMWRAREQLGQSNVAFLPAVNEDLAATAILGAQQASLDRECQVEGVFSMWYGKGPGVDRSGDALRHGNAYGSSAKGGVLVVAGDDHGCVSSSMPHQSDVAFMTYFIPTLNPASVSEYCAFGEYGIALSRFSGTWVGFKAISETVESGQSVELQPDRAFVAPDFVAPAGGIHVRRSDLPSTEIETRIAAKLKAVEAFVNANPIDRKVYDLPNANYGFVTTGKGHLDLMEALRLLGLNEARCRDLGIDIYKIGLVWPLARRDALDFVRDKREILVIEEKRGIIESQLKEAFYDWPGDKPRRMVGKHDSQNNPLVPWVEELSPLKLVPIIAKRLDAFFPEENLLSKAALLTEKSPPIIRVAGAKRTPYFCSGCPHNTSTKLPEGSMAASGIGCHVMASWMDRETVGFAQMGGEGVPWVASALYNGNKHIFQNLGEGTWYHSGSLAIRQAVAANTNITYKILYNDAVAMTGGQPVDGPISVPGIAHSCRAEGVKRIAVVSDDLTKYNHSEFPSGTTFDHRSRLDMVQRDLRGVNGVSVLIYEQTCATEKRRRRKRGTLEDPKRFAVINELVCEGCGDCSVESNCLSVEPVETEFGRKRRINQSSCNKDFTCLNGFCPSFVTIEGGRLRKKKEAGVNVDALLGDVPDPDIAPLRSPYGLLVTGVGGTGVVTVGALITMAAHLEGKGASVLDFTGFAQKFGTVLSYIRLAPRPSDLNQVRIEDGRADAVIGCDIVVSSAPKASAHYKVGTRIVLNRAEMPTGDLVLNRDAELRVDDREMAIRAVVGEGQVQAFDANKTAEKLMGDSVYANVMLLGYAWQSGLVPVSVEALNQAIVLNGVAVEKNQIAFSYGRILAARPQSMPDTVKEKSAKKQSLTREIQRRSEFLISYQNTSYARRYRETLAPLRDVLPEEMQLLAAKSLFKLMAYKDEYEVARLHTERDFIKRLSEQFEGDFKIHYHLAPPAFDFSKDARGRPVKRAFGPWMGSALKLLARVKPVRGTVLDPFRFSRDRKLDVALIQWFEECLRRVVAGYSDKNETAARLVLSAPLEMRGYGPVKEQAVAKWREKADTALASY